MSKICIVSEECNGVAPAGGIGACVRGLAELWTRQGHQVDLIITKLDASGETTMDKNVRFANRVLSIRELHAKDKQIYPPNDAQSSSYHVYRYLRDRDYDEVHFNEFVGSGFYTAMARRQGLFSATVITHLHGSSEWVRTYNLNPPSLEDLEREAMERSQIENSDLVISPSQYLLDWYAQNGVALPSATRRQWILPQWLDPNASASSSVCPRSSPSRQRARCPRRPCRSRWGTR